MDMAHRIVIPEVDQPAKIYFMGSSTEVEVPYDDWLKLEAYLKKTKGIKYLSIAGLIILGAVLSYSPPVQAVIKYVLALA